MKPSSPLDRRDLIAKSFGAVGVLSLSSSLMGMASSSPFLSGSGLQSLGELGKANAFGARVPPGYTIKVLAETGKNVLLANGRSSKYVWHGAPDGGACFESSDGGWIYVSNSELDLKSGGVGALRFDKYAQVIDAYPVLQGTSRNCAGGPTPWKTWLSCEEADRGAVYECDPEGAGGGKIRPALGFFKHEAAAVDPVLGHIYLTEDEKDGCLYRYTPSTIANDGRMDLDEGLLEVAVMDGPQQLAWEPILNPTPNLFQKETRKQIKGAKVFNGGEGIWYHQGSLVFSTKGDDRIWSYNTSSQNLRVIYEKTAFSRSPLSGVDNVTVSSEGHILVGEDGGDMQIVVISSDARLYPLVQLEGHDLSEITGPAIAPNQSQLYFSSQRGPSIFGRGVTYAMSGIFK